MSEVLTALLEMDAALRRAISSARAAERAASKRLPAAPPVNHGIRFTGAVGKALLEWLRRQDNGFTFTGEQALKAIQFDQTIANRKWTKDTSLATDCAARLHYFREKGWIDVKERTGGRPTYKLLFVPGKLHQQSAALAEQVRSECGARNAECGTGEGDSAA